MGLGFERVVMLLAWIGSGLSFRFCRGKELLGFNRTLLEVPQTLEKRDKFRREEENHIEFLRCSTALGKYLAVAGRAALPKGRLLDMKQSVYREERLVFETPRCY